MKYLFLKHTTLGSQLPKWFLMLGMGLVFATALSVQAQENLGTVEGFVRGKNGPYVGAKVVITTDVLGSYEGIKFTDQQGYFSRSRVPSGGEVHIAVYDGAGQLIGQGSGMLSRNGETILVNIDVAP